MHTYLLTEKGMHTFIKCNPTLLGYEFARETLDRMGAPRPYSLAIKASRNQALIYSSWAWGTYSSVDSAI